MIITRRQLLVLGSAAGAAVLVPKIPAVSGPNGSTLAHHPAGHRAATGRAAAVAPFTARMPVPRTLQPFRSDADTDHYRLDIRAATAEILPGVRTPVLGYGGGLGGPTIRARTGRRTVVTYTNGLAEAANVHLHGGHVPPGSDGHPMDIIEPGQARRYVYPNRQQGATLWYHDHAHHTEAEHVYRGLHGVYIVDDAQERALRLPADRYDVPILLRDAELDAAGNLVFGDPAARTVLLANGKPTPYFPVAARRYRFRLLNGATHRTYTLSLSAGTMVQVGSDGGLLPAPVPLTELRLAPAERADVVIDFGAHPVGTQLVLSDVDGGPVLRFDVVAEARETSRVPARLRPLAAAPLAVVERDVQLGMLFDGTDAFGVIDGKTFDPNRVDMTIRRGDTEIWRVRNTDVEFGIPHTLHLHLVQFRILDRDGRPPAANEVGRKDTVLVNPGETVRLQATFTDYVGRYAFHCHMLDHSRVGMMAQMEIVP
jgi:spore coat protein A